MSDIQWYTDMHHSSPSGSHYCKQGCGSVSSVFSSVAGPDPGWEKVSIRIRDDQPGSYFLELRNHVLVSLGLNYLFFDEDPGSGMESVRIRDSGSGMEKIQIRDPG